MHRYLRGICWISHFNFYQLSVRKQKHSSSKKPKLTSLLVNLLHQLHHLHQTEADDCGLRVVAVAESVSEAGSNRDHVFECTAQLHTDLILYDHDAEVIGLEKEKLEHQDTKLVCVRAVNERRENLI